MRRFFILFLIQGILANVFAQIPEGYYDDANGYCGASLKTALYNIIKDHTVISYDGLWDAFKTTDRRADGKVWDIYSSTTNYTFGTDQAGNYSREGDVYNREHSFPKSWFNDARPMYSDLFHLYPSDGYVNGRRSNYPYGETDNPTYTSNGGFSKLGPSSVPGYTGTVFEPADEYKGDLARTYFYMATRYENLIANWNCDMLAHNQYPAYASWALEMLLRWAEEDPVSQKEIDRNNAIYGYQKNRNPFIDYPGLEEYIWGDKMDVLFDADNYGNEGEITVMKPVFSPASGTVSNGTNIKISTGTPGANIVYTLNDGTPVEVANPANLTINASAEITAYAILDGVKSATASASYIVEEGGTPGVSGMWSFSPVTSTADLTIGAQYLIVCEELGVAMGAANNDIRGYATISFDNGLIYSEVNGNNQPYTFTLGGASGQYTFFDATGNYYLSLNSSGNKLHYSTDQNSQNAQWDIVISEEEGTRIINNAYATRRIQYNASAPRFACYESNQKAVALYKIQYVQLNITNCQYATYYGEKPFYLPAELKAGLVTGADTQTNTLVIDWAYQGGSIIPSQTGVIINGPAGDYTCKTSKTDAAQPENNLLKGSLADEETSGTNCLFYKLSEDINQPLGFYWGADNGAPFINKANKAYLAIDVNQANNIEFFTFEQITGIQETVKPERGLVNVYSISGTLLKKQVLRKDALKNLPSGIYIIGGKKIIK